MLSLLTAFTLALSLANASPVPTFNEVDARDLLGVHGALISSDGLTELGTTVYADIPKVAKVSVSALASLDDDGIKVHVRRGGKGLLGNGGLLGTGIGACPGLLGTGLLAGSECYHWTAPTGWVRPSWYEFGFFHPDTGAWVNSQVEVIAFLKGLAFHQVSINNAYPLFPLTSGYYPNRALDWTRRNRFGYWNDAGLFIDLDLDIAVSILLGSCGYSRII